LPWCSTTHFAHPCLSALSVLRRFWRFRKFRSSFTAQAKSRFPLSFPFSLTLSRLLIPPPAPSSRWSSASRLPPSLRSSWPGDDLSFLFMWKQKWAIPLTVYGNVENVSRSWKVQQWAEIHSLKSGWTSQAERWFSFFSIARSREYTIITTISIEASRPGCAKIVISRQRPIEWAVQSFSSSNSTDLRFVLPQGSLGTYRAHAHATSWRACLQAKENVGSVRMHGPNGECLTASDGTDKKR